MVIPVSACKGQAADDHVDGDSKIGRRQRDGDHVRRSDDFVPSTRRVKERSIDA